jgi:hypothetical protein
MRTRVVAVVALLSLPCALSAQIIRIPPSALTPADPAPLPPTISEVARVLAYKHGEIARVLAYKRAPWSFEGSAMMSAIQVPTAAGPTVNYSAFGTGTHADYRISDRFAATGDMTVSALGGPEMETAEVGARFRPLPPGMQITPFFDLRGGYTRLADSYSIPLGAVGIGGATAYSDGQRYSGGFGAVAGAGIDAFISGSWGFTAEMLAVRSAMTTYAMSGGDIPSRSRYGMTSFRFAVGLKYTVTQRHFDQNPRQ